MMTRAQVLKLVKRFVTYAAPAVFIYFAISYLNKASDQTTRDNVLHLISEFSWSSLGLSVLATMVSFALLSGSEILGFRSSQTKLDWRRIMKVSFISFGVSNTLSLAGFASTSLRFRLYMRDRIPAPAILKVLAFSSAGVWIGFFVLLGLCIFIQPINLPPEFHVSLLQLHLFGGVTLMLVAAYIVMSWRQRPVITIRGHRLSFPTLRFALGQIGLAMVDWSIASLALYVLLPVIPGVDFPRFLYVFLIAQIIGAVTYLPGGLGILEILTIYLLLPDRQVTPEVAAALVLYRSIYYVIPLVIALIMLAVDEIVESSHLAAVVFRGILRISSNWVPVICAASTLVIGLYFMFEGSLLVPLTVRTVASSAAWTLSHLSLSSYGFFVLILSDGLRRRSHSAWALSLFVVFWTTVALVLLHAGWSAIGGAILLCALLIFTRSEFFRRSRLFNEVWSTQWTSFSVLFLFGLSWMVFVTAHDITLYSHPWWELLPSAASPYLSFSLAPAIGASGLSLWRLIVPNGKPSIREPYLSFTLSQARPIAMASPITQSQIVLLGDKSLFCSQDRDGFIMYAVEGKTWVVLGDPVCPPAKLKSMLADFYSFVDRQGGAPVFYQTQPNQLSQYVDFGYQLLKVGEEARVFLPQFTLEGRDRKSMRNTCNRMEKEGVTFDILAAADLDAHWDQLETISKGWLKAGRIKEKGFSLGYFDRDYLANFDHAVLRKDGQIVAFANLWQSQDHSELSIDLMRSSEQSPSGAMEFMFIKIMEWGREQKFEWFNLGMAPLSGLERKVSISRTWNQLGSIIYDSGEAFYNFKGVRNFKEKFSPVWEARYLAYPNAFSLPTVLTDVARLISRGSRKKKVKRAKKKL